MIPATLVPVEKVSQYLESSRQANGTKGEKIGFVRRIRAG
jgi:hypothetical protein